MNKNLFLIQQLNKQRESKKEDLLPSGINYQEYILEVEKQELLVLIPFNESNNFENTLNQINILDKDYLREILRKHRGIQIRNNT